MEDRMKKENWFQKISVITLVCMLIFANPTWVLAENLQNQKNENNKQINDAQQDLKQVQSEKKSTITQVEEMEDEIEKYTDEIKELESKLSNLGTSIEEAQTKLDEAEEDYIEQETLLNERLIMQYEEGETSYLDVLLSSANLTDFISNYYMVSELATYDIELLDKIEQQKKEIEQTKKALQEQKQEVETTKQSKDAKTKQLVNTKKEKDAKIASLSEQEKEIQEQISDLKKANRSIDAKIEAANKKKQEANKNHGNTTSGGNNSSTSSGKGGFIKPVSGYPVTTGWYYSNGSLHGAVDFSGSGISGKPVMAAKSGTVIIVEHLTSSYGNYVMIDHNDGTYSLYAHMKTTAVSEGQNVSQGQTIGYVGNSGNVYPRPSASNPIAGTHLHFEIRTGSGKYSERVNPLNYL